MSVRMDETFAVALRSWRKLGGLGPEQQRAWLFTVARRLLARYLRRAQVERRAVQRLGMQPGRPPLAGRAPRPVTELRERG